MTPREVMALAVKADVDLRIAQDEVRHPERWAERGGSRARERVREILRVRDDPGRADETEAREGRVSGQVA